MLLSFILRMGLPQLKFIFIPLFFYFTVYVLYKIFTCKTIPGIKIFLLYKSIYLLLLGIYLGAMVYENDFLLPVKEFISGTILLILFYFFYFFLISVRISFDRIKKLFIRQFIVIIAVVSLAGFIKLIYSALGWSFPLSPKLAQNALTSSITSDYNFFSLAVIMGLLTVLYQLYVREKISRKEMIGYNLLMGLFSFVVLTSQSRRSFLILLVIITVLLIGRILTLIWFRRIRIGLLRRNDLYLVAMFSMFFVGYILIFFTSDQLKRQFLKNNNLYQSNFRIELTNAINRYTRILGFGFQQKNLYNLLWKQDEQPAGELRTGAKRWFDRKFLEKDDSGQLSDYLRKKDETDYKSNSIETPFDLRNSLSSNMKIIFEEELQMPDLSMNSSGRESYNSTEIGRTKRWQYGLELYKGYSFNHKIFGDGFTYLSRFGQKINGNPKTYEYPHNSLISAILYSGIIGAAIYVFFLVYTIILYLRNFNALQYFFILFLITGVYMSISGNSYFSVPAFAFLSLIPWFYLSLTNKIEA